MEEYYVLFLLQCTVLVCWQVMEFHLALKLVAILSFSQTFVI